MEVQRDKLIFSTGKSVYCYGEKVALDLTDGGPERLYYGSDGAIRTALSPDHDSEFDGDALTREECIELADHMIDAWQAYRAQLAG